MSKKKTQETQSEDKKEANLFPTPKFIHHLSKAKISNFVSFPPFLVVFMAAILIALIAAVFALRIMFTDRIYPGISIAHTDVSGLTKLQAQQKLETQIANRTNQTATFQYKDLSNNNQTTSFNLADFKDNLDTQSGVDQAFDFGHNLFYLPPLNLTLDFNQDITQEIKPLAESVNEEPIDSEIKISGTEINVTPSQDGYILDQQQFQKDILAFINSGKFTSDTLPMKKAEPKVDFATASQIKKRLDSNKMEPLVLSYKESSASAQKQTFTLDFNTLLTLLDLQQDNYLDEPKIDNYLKTLAQRIDRPVQEPLFNFDPNSPNKVTEFSPPVTGKRLDLPKAKQLLSQALLNENIKEIELPVETVNPKNKLTNDMGIKELIGQGKSSFEGSINNRIFNLKLATTKLNGVLIPPGEVFSFLQSTGDISQSTGYKQAYVIKSGKTVLDDGGGVCQVSTTLFRAVLNSGLPVLERNQHAYRVSYYELGGSPPGLDAAIFIPGVDFKFKNDTNHHILIQAYSEGNNLYFNLYGTSDGRIVELTKPVITNRTPPPPELRQDDPTLPKGEVKQVERAVEGANVVFYRKVIKDGQVLINESFKSNFRAWQAVFLVGTKEG